MLDRSKGMVHSIPALSTKVVDCIGAGDAFLSLAGICLGGGLPSEVAAFRRQRRSSAGCSDRVKP